MGTDWHLVAGEEVNLVDEQTVKALAGLNPRDETQLAKIRKALGLSAAEIFVWEKKKNDAKKPSKDDDDSNDDSSSKNDTSNDEEESEDDEDQVDENEGELSQCLAFKDSVDRMQIYHRLVTLGRSLLSPPLLTGKKKIYSDLNCIVSQVTMRTHTFIDGRSVCGQKARR